VTKPTHHQLDELMAYLRRQDWHHLHQRMAQAIKRDRTARAVRDGFGSGGDGGVDGGDRPDPTGSAATSKPPRDEVHDNVKAAAKHLAAAVKELQHFTSRLDLLEHRAVAPETEPACATCARAEHWSPVHRSSDVGGRLPQPRPLCRWCHDFVRNMDRLPTSEEVQAHHEGRRVRLRAS
jgi:hypothetical protein